MPNITQEMQELLSRLPKTDTYPFRSVINPEYSRQHIALSLTPANLLLAMHRAREAQELAVSYRGFKVGAALVGLSFQPSNFQIMTGVNIKPDEESAMNVHAEQSALQKAHDRNVDAVSMIVVVGETQSDKQSGHEMHTLHPCGLCRGIMNTNSLVDKNATLIASTLPNFSTIELYSVNEFIHYHETHDDSLLHRFQLPQLSLFDPIDQTNEPIILQDTAESINDENIWNATIGTYLMQRRLKLLNDV